MRDTFCIPCSSFSCAHINGPTHYFRKHEVSILRSMLDPTTPTAKQIAEALHIKQGTLKVYISRMQDKLGWRSGSMRLLTLWVVAHAAELGAPLPTPESFRVL
jgi:DNA-binding NarL/FixJ family response regulator